MQDFNTTIRFDDKSLNNSIRLDEVIDYNLERDNSEYDKHEACANIMGDIGNSAFFGQVQYDNWNKEYSVDCDGNVFYDEIKTAVFNNFNQDELVIDEDDWNKSDLYFVIENQIVDQVVRQICAFGEKAINNFISE